MPPENLGALEAIPRKRERGEHLVYASYVESLARLGSLPLRHVGKWQWAVEEGTGEFEEVWLRQELRRSGDTKNSVGPTYLTSKGLGL